MLSKNYQKFILSLGQKKVRDEHSLFIAENDKLIIELANSGVVFEKILISEDFTHQLPPYLQSQTETVSINDFKKITTLKTPQSILAICRKPDHKINIESLPKKLSIVIDTVQDPGNLGTIIRMANWFGISEIICSLDTVDAYNPKVVQATMGAIAKINISYTNLEQFFDDISYLNIPIYGTFLEGENIFTSELTTNGIIIMGNEGNGISKSVEKHVTNKLYIPSFPISTNKVESLNVSIAASIVCAEFRRRLLQ